MKFRLATIDDLPQLKAVYGNIVENMKKDNIDIWDEIYPYEFFSDDINNNSLYVLVEDNEIVSAFVLSESNEGESHVEWENKHGKALYLDRFGVNINYLRKGIGSIVLNEAMTIAKDRGFQYLRLFVVDINVPAIKLYIKNGFKRVDGIYNQIIDDDLVLREFGFEVKISELSF